jgi:hypothetical protein
LVRACAWGEGEIRNYFSETRAVREEQQLSAKGWSGYLETSKSRIMSWWPTHDRTCVAARASHKRMVRSVEQEKRSGSCGCHLIFTTPSSWPVCSACG